MYDDSSRDPTFTDEEKKRNELDDELDNSSERFNVRKNDSTRNSSMSSSDSSDACQVRKKKRQKKEFTKPVSVQTGNVTDTESEEDIQPTNKSKRDRTAAGKIKRAKDKHPFKDINCGCKNECNAKIDNPKEIYDQFWEMSFDKRKQFLHARVSRLMKTRTTVTGMENEDYRSKRFCTYFRLFLHQFQKW